jgi:chemotaxis protein CheD
VLRDVPSLATEREAAADDSRAGAGRRTIYLHPGKLYASSEPCAVTTILGSCVAVCLWDPVLGIGGINHYLLPHGPGNGQSSERFGDVAIPSLIGKLLALGSATRGLRAKLFGGACVIDAMRASDHNLGAKNVEAACRLLEEEGIPVVGGDVGGPKGRKLIFHSDDGTAWVKLL